MAMPMEDFAAIEVLQQREIRLIQDIAQLEQRSPILEQLLAAGLHSCLTIPMNSQGALIGELYLASIFRVFERLHGIEVYPGTGIGLAIVRKALEKMGGLRGVESQLGQGSRFFFALPKAVFENNSISS